VGALLKLAQLPARAPLELLKRSTDPRVQNVISAGIARASIGTLQSEGRVQIEGVEVVVDFNEQRLKTTAGFASAMTLGTAVFLGNKLRIKARYAELARALDRLKFAVLSDDVLEIEAQLDTVQKLSTPTIDPSTLARADDAEDYADLYSLLFAKNADEAVMFGGGALVDDVARAVSVAEKGAIRVATLKAVASNVDEALEQAVKRGAGIGGKAVSRVAGAVLWVDTIWWLATSAIDLGLNELGIPEEDQKIPFLSEIPYIGALFDVGSGKLGSSFIDDLILSPIVNGVLGLFFDEEDVDVVLQAIYAIISSAVLSPTLAPFVIALLDFYIDDLRLEFVNMDLELGELSWETKIDLFGWTRKVHPEDLLVYAFLLIMSKLVVRMWIVPAWSFIRGAPVS